MLDLIKNIGKGLVFGLVLAASLVWLGFSWGMSLVAALLPAFLISANVFAGTIVKLSVLVFIVAVANSVFIKSEDAPLAKSAREVVADVAPGSEQVKSLAADEGALKKSFVNMLDAVTDRIRLGTAQPQQVAASAKSSAGTASNSAQDKTSRSIKP